MNLTQLRAARPAELSTAAREFHRLATAIDRDADRLHDEVRRPLAAAWDGGAATAALRAVDALIERWGAAADRMREVSRAVDVFAEALRAAQSVLNDLDRVAAGAGLTIGEAGEVEFPDGVFGADEGQFAAAEQIHSRLGPRLTAVGEADLACATVFGLPEPESDPSWWEELYGGLGWFSSAQTVLYSANSLAHVMDLPSIPFSGLLTAVTSGQGLWTEVGSLLDEDERRSGIGLAAQVYKAEFQAASLATLVAPNPYTAIAAVSAAALWGGANLLEMHWDSVTDAWGATQRGADRAWDGAWEFGEGVFESGGDLLDRGGDLLGSVL
ncbi:hypothetical protein CS0771_57790 [Catellatospora sp. IY07-71]|uniref:WXG100 family type VII secretion target n=1 Tax=Catellatospora sp. IY07-71 TaxID=2728827 RepID=UPI001BB363AE|nr:hypothetical protein [Catellatospora sp. IY07-71]BCJ76235.1 hypothetical protein CS0771_57790 [Catellatospora sp. IY07-71]